MSTINLEQNELVTCDLCKRRYNINVYKRHINENQCIKRNQHRVPFESIKQRSIQIGDKTFSVQKQHQKNPDVRTLISNENEKQQVSKNNNNNNKNNKSNDEKFHRIMPSTNRRRTLEYAKELLQRRTKYKPPPIAKRSHLTKLTEINVTTKFKNDDIPIEISNRHNYISTVSPGLKHKPQEEIKSIHRPLRQISTWTRSLKQPSEYRTMSPIRIPTYRESSSGPSYEPISTSFIKDNDDDDEFEYYSPTPISTPKYQQDKIQIKRMSPISYYKTNRSKLQTKSPSKKSLPNEYSQKSIKSLFRLPPIKASTLKQTRTINLTPWR